MQQESKGVAKLIIAIGLQVSTNGNYDSVIYTLRQRGYKQLDLNKDPNTSYFQSEDEEAQSVVSVFEFADTKYDAIIRTYRIG